MADLPIVRGDSPTYDIAVSAPGGGAQNLTSCTFWWTAKPAADNDLADASAVIKHYVVINGSGAVTSSLGLSIGTGGATGGNLVHKILASESTLLTLLSPQFYLWELSVLDAVGDTHTITAGTMTVSADITRRTTTP